MSPNNGAACIIILSFCSVSRISYSFVEALYFQFKCVKEDTVQVEVCLMWTLVTCYVSLGRQTSFPLPDCL